MHVVGEVVLIVYFALCHTERDFLVADSASL